MFYGQFTMNIRVLVACTAKRAGWKAYSMESIYTEQEYRLDRNSDGQEYKGSIYSR